MIYKVDIIYQTGLRSAAADLLGEARTGCLMKKLALALAITLGGVAAAHAADLPTRKERPDAGDGKLLFELVGFYEFDRGRLPAHIWTIDALPHPRCGLRLQHQWRQLESGLCERGRQRHQQTGLRPKWQQVPNGINQSVVGLKLSQPIGWGWSIVGTVETAADPLFALDRERPALAGHEQRQGASSAELITATRAARANGTIRKASSASVTRPMAHWLSAA